MKMKSFKLLPVLGLIIFLVTGCAGGVSKDAIKNAIANEENCLKGCDEKEAKALTDFKNCIKPYQEKLRTALNVCSHVPPANRLECETSAFNKFESDIELCLTALRTKLEEVEKCRKDCRDKFPLELKL